MKRPLVIFLLGVGFVSLIGAIGFLRTQEKRPAAALPIATTAATAQTTPAFSANKTSAIGQARSGGTASEYILDAPRKRNELGQPLPFRETKLAADTVDVLRRAQPGNVVTLDLFPGVHFAMHVTGRWNDADGIRVAAKLDGHANRDRFFMSWNQDGARGLVELPSQNLAYEVVSTSDGSYLVREWLLTDVVCASPLPDGHSADSGLPRPAESVPGTTIAQISPGQVPVLNSRTAASAVIYIDFDGETVSGSGWANGGTIGAPAARLNASQINEVWERVVRDYENFDVNITTDRAVFNAAPLIRRIQCVVTSNDAAAPGAGGVAYIDVFASTDNSLKVCWAFIDNNAKSCAEVISHEVGHTLGLHHDGRNASGSLPREEYYAGHGSGATGWAPIMGVGYFQELTQWSKGEYNRANNPEDDLAIMSTAAKIPYLSDDCGNTTATASAVTGDRVDGIIERNTDLDFYRINLPAGTYTIVLQPSSYSDADLELDVLDSASHPIATSNPADQLSATTTFNLASPQTIFLRVTGVGPGDLLGIGYSNYASLGNYNITGFGNQQQPPSAPIGLSTKQISGTQIRVSWTANPSATSYQLYRDGALLGTVSVTEFLDCSLQPSTAYAYTVVALNSHGSSPSSPASVVTTPAFDEFIMDGDPDFAGYLVANPGMTIYAAVRGTKLYVATYSPGDNGSGYGNDHHILISDTLLASATTPAPWAKRGLMAIPGNKPFLAGESNSTYAGWSNTQGTTKLFKSPVSSGVVEGVIDLVAEFGAMPENVYVAAVAYETNDASASNTSFGRINSQAPAGNGNDNLEPGEFLRIPVRSVADSRQNGIYNILAPDREFAVQITFDTQTRPVLGWKSVPGNAYEVFRTSNLQTGLWERLTPTPRTAGATEWEMSHTDIEGNLGAQQFYRVSHP